MTGPEIYLITDGRLRPENFAAEKERSLEIIKTAAENNVSLIQIREKLLPARHLFELVEAAVRATRNSGARLLVNDRADVALAAGADGVHLTENSVPAGIVRRAFGKNLIIGVSAHTIESAKKARARGADFVTFSPVFETPGKGAAVGLKALAAAVEMLSPFPVIALGGIDSTNYKKVLETGAAGFAAIRFLNNTENLKALGLKETRE